MLGLRPVAHAFLRAASPLLATLVREPQMPGLRPVAHAFLRAASPILATSVREPQMRGSRPAAHAFLRAASPLLATLFSVVQTSAQSNTPVGQAHGLRGAPGPAAQ